MRKFINGSDQAFKELNDRANHNCIVFANEEMPFGTMPSHGRVGFEAISADGTVTLFVQKGLQYSGSNQDVFQWISNGQRNFASWRMLVKWIRDELAKEYRSQSHDTQINNGMTAPMDIQSYTDIPVVMERVSKEKVASLPDKEKLYTTLASEVRGQEIGLREIAFRTYLHIIQTKPTSPATIFLIGPTGVGKTKSAETLPAAIARSWPDGPKYHYLRLDMSEYQERYRVSQLIGSPQGYIGHGDGAQLSNHLYENPYSVVLFDEIEKAHPDVLRLIMNAMDAGRLSSAAQLSGGGHQIDCRNAIFSFTSNLGAENLLRYIKDNNAWADRSALAVACRKHLTETGIPKEIVGRINSFAVFDHLSDKARAEAMALSILRIAHKYDVKLSYVEPTVIVALLNESENDGFGVRPGEVIAENQLAEILVSANNADKDAKHKLIGPPFAIVSQ